ncbi:hypothetical protein JCM10207_003102 [Rhodosporidiobolus poonsookiae]
MLLLVHSLHTLLSHLTHPSGAPHSALVANLAQGGAVVAAHSTPTEPPFPPASLEQCDDDDARAGCYAALAVGSWHAAKVDERNGDKDQPVMLDTELGRIALVALGNFLLVLVGNEVAPWKVLDTKIRVAAERLKDPLSKVPA